MWSASPAAPVGWKTVDGCLKGTGMILWSCLNIYINICMQTGLRNSAVFVDVEEYYYRYLMLNITEMIKDRAICSYHGRPIKTRMQSFNWCCFQWSRLAPKLDICQRQITQKWWKIAELLVVIVEWCQDWSSTHVGGIVMWCYLSKCRQWFVRLNVIDKSNLEWRRLCRSERRIWLSILFSVCAVVYATRAVMPLCVVAVSREYQWTKTEMVVVSFIFNPLMGRGNYSAHRIIWSWYTGRWLIIIIIIIRRGLGGLGPRPGPSSLYQM